MPEKRFWCELCGVWITHDAPNDDVMEGIDAAQDHFRVLHPDVFSEIERWPDGSVVVYDNTLEPEDFIE